MSNETEKFNYRHPKMKTKQKFYYLEYMDLKSGNRYNFEVNSCPPQQINFVGKGKKIR